MSPPSDDATPAELSILELLWERQPQTIREITARLYPDGDAAHYATVQKLLDRLESKRFVTRERAGRAHQFRASVKRTDLIGRRLRIVADQLCRGSLAPLLTHLVAHERLGEEEIDELKRLLDKIESRREGRGS